MTHRELAKIIKAVGANASKDDRRNLQHIHVRDAHTLEATDGAALLRVTLPGQGHGLALGFYDPKRALALLKADVLPQPELGVLWPNTDAVIPREDTPCEISSHGVLFRPELFARVLDSVHALVECKPPTPVRLAFGDPLAPVRLDARSADGVVVVAVVMPMRFEPRASSSVAQAA